MTAFQSFPRSWTVFSEAMSAWISDRLWVKSIIKDKLGIEDSRILFTEHHLSHAASAFYPSTFDEAAILTIDGVGEWTTASVGKGSGTDIQLLKEIRFPHSLGLGGGGAKGGSLPHPGLHHDLPAHKRRGNLRRR